MSWYREVLAVPCYAGFQFSFLYIQLSGVLLKCRLAKGQQLVICFFFKDISPLYSEQVLLLLGPEDVLTHVNIR